MSLLVLVAILLPSLKQAWVAVCSSNQRQLGIALYLYAEDSRGRLPNLSCATSLNSFTHHPFWHMAILPYMSNQIAPERGVGPGQIAPGFGYNGLDESLVFMPCPSAPRDDYFWMTYGVVYPTVFAFGAKDMDYTKLPDASQPYYDGSAKIEKIPPEVYIAADWKSAYGPNHSEILNPGASGSWRLDYDTDSDGVADSNAAHYFASGFVLQYSMFAPRHNRTGQLLFADASVQRIPIREWADKGNGNEGSRGNPPLHASFGADPAE